MDDNATVSLAATATLAGLTVRDRATGIVHELSDGGAHALAELVRGATFGATCDRLATGAGVPVEIVRGDLAEMLDRLDDYDLICVRRDRRGVISRLRSAAATMWDMRYPAVALAGFAGWISRQRGLQVCRRYQADWSGLLRAVMRSQAPVMRPYAAMVLGAMVLIEAVSPNPDRLSAGFVADNLLKFVVIAAVFIGLVVAHEGGHLLALWSVGGRAQYITARGMAVSVVHPRLEVRREAWVGAAGPVAALVLGVATSLALHWRLNQPIGMSYATLATLALALAFLHVLSLGPWSSDGAPLWVAVRRGWRRFREQMGWAGLTPSASGVALAPAAAACVTGSGPHGIDNEVTLDVDREASDHGHSAPAERWRAVETRE